MTKSVKTNKSSKLSDAPSRLNSKVSGNRKPPSRLSKTSSNRSNKTAKLFSKPSRSSTGSKFSSRPEEPVEAAPSAIPSAIPPAVPSAAVASDASSAKSRESERLNRRVLTGVPQVDTKQRQFPIPVKKKKRGKSGGRKRRRDKDELLTIGPASLYGNWRCFVLDRYQLEARAINRYRVDGKKDFPCYIYDEMHRYDNNTFYRNAMLGNCLGASLYFMTLIFVIMPKTNELFDLFEDQKFSITFIPILLAAIFLTFVLRLCTFLYLSSYMIALIQILVLAFTVLGNLDNECRRQLAGANQTQSRPLVVPVTGAGQLPVLAMASIEDSIKMEPDALRRALVLARCDQSLRRYCAVNLLAAQDCRRCSEAGRKR